MIPFSSSRINSLLQWDKRQLLHSSLVWDVPKRIWKNPGSNFMNCTFLHIMNQTGPLKILKPKDQEIGEFCVVQERYATDFEALKLWKGRSGTGIFVPRFADDCNPDALTEERFNFKLPFISQQLIFQIEKNPFVLQQIKSREGIPIFTAEQSCKCVGECVPYVPTDTYTTLKLQNPLHDIPELHNLRRSPDLEALKLRKSRSGCFTQSYSFTVRSVYHGNCQSSHIRVAQCSITFTNCLCIEAFI